MPESPANTLEADDAAAPALTTELQRIAGLAARFLGVSTGAVSLLVFFFKQKTAYEI